MKYEQRNKPRKVGLRLDLWVIHNYIWGGTHSRNIDIDQLKAVYPQHTSLIDMLYDARVYEDSLISINKKLK